MRYVVKIKKKFTQVTLQAFQFGANKIWVTDNNNLFGYKFLNENILSNLKLV